MSTPECSSFSPLGGRRKPKNITLLSFNTNELSRNIPELTNCMSEYGVDITLIQETFLKPTKPRACAIAGYVQLRKDRTHARRGGTALYYSRSLHCCPIDIPPLINMEATGCRLAMTDHRTLVIVSVYLPSPQPLHRSDLRALLALGDAVILFGDFNCKNPRWGCPVLDYNGNKLDQLQDRLEFEIIAPSVATHYPHNVTHRPSTIDIALTKGVVLNLNRIETLHKLTSDHRLVLLKMGPPDGGRPNPTCKITDWKRVLTALEKIDTPPLNSIPDNIRTIDEINSAIGALTSHIRTVVKKCEREVPASSDHRKFPPVILELIRAKNKALRRASAYPTPEYRSRARDLQREVKARVQEFRNESWSDLMEEIRPSHKAFWRITKALKTEGYTPIPPLKRPDGSTALDDAEVAECIADSIETQCSHASPLHDPAHISRIEEEVLQETSLDLQDDLTLVSLSEVQTLMKSLKTRKAPGLDGIHKPGKPRDLPASYRPISLLSGLAKLYERVLKTRLTDHLLGKGLIIDEQFGFRPVHSCPQQVLRLVEYATEGFKRKNKTVAVFFFDVAKAFDRTLNQSKSSSRLRPLPPPYSAYTNDIPRPTSGVQLALFADDTALFYRNRYRDVAARRLQRAIDELGQWFRLWRIEVNPEKSAAIQFKYSKRRSKFVVDYNTPTLKMLNARIPWQRSYKYLGVTLDRNLNFRYHIARVRKTALFVPSKARSLAR
ncbi:RNA-directed DNA polymerase from mobile element jockey [Eumeta japonica]|uniref:RNA-directed DNA polymerase from mobile element jockey n=1 Tax=Eumeta variegata TaxID=151549 RepID=A0A4C1SAV3_EUMVA|nr:RNA-directed DNA polymerase from mobile element jockey [Eumeta japonica]